MSLLSAARRAVKYWLRVSDGETRSTCPPQEKGKSTVVITSNGHAAGVLLSPLEYDSLTYTHRFLSAVKEGLSDSDAGRTRSTEEVLGKFHGKD
jgi:hypothetical protein